MTRRRFGGDSAAIVPPAGQPIYSAAGLPFAIYADAGATTPADVQTSTGGPLTKVCTIGGNLPDMLGPPDGADTLYVTVNGGPLWAIYANVDDRLDDLTTRLAAAETGVAAGIPTTQKGAAGGVATLDGSTHIPDAQIPATIARDSEVTSSVAAAVAALVNSAPGTLDTLAEIATALGNDPNLATTLTAAIGTKAAQAALDAEIAARAAADTAEATTRATADALAIPLTQRAAANGVATLDAGSKIPDGQIPDGITRDTELATAVAALVNAAPTTLDTLAEIAAALGNDPNLATTLTNAIALKAALAGATFTGDVQVPDAAYDATTWDGSVKVPTRNAVRDALVSLFAAEVTRSNTTYAPIANGRPGNLAVFLGDSVTLGSDSTTTSTTRGECWPVYLSMVSGQRIQYVRNAGVSGNTSAQMLARFDTDVTPYAPNVVTLLCGTNDTGNAVPLATFQANVIAIVAKIRAIGAVPVLFTMPPNSTGTPVNRKQQIIMFNAWIRRYTATQNIALVDIYNALVDPTTGGYQAAYTSDNTHPTQPANLVIANLANTVMSDVVPTHPPLLCQDNIDENNLLLSGCFPYTGTALPTSWVDAAGTPAGSALSYTTDALVPGKLLTVTSTATAGVRQMTYSVNVGGATTMPATIAGATSFALSVNPFTKGVLFIGTPGSATFEIAKVSSVSGGGPYTATLTRALVYAHSAGEQVVVNCAVGDVMAFSGLVTTDGGCLLNIGPTFTGASGFKAANALTQPLTRAVWYMEHTIPAGATQATPYLQVGAGTGVTSFGQVGYYNLTRMGV